MRQRLPSLAEAITAVVLLSPTTVRVELEGVSLHYDRQFEKWVVTLGSVALIMEETLKGAVEVFCKDVEEARRRRLYDSGYDTISC